MGQTQRPLGSLAARSSRHATRKAAAAAAAANIRSRMRAARRTLEDMGYLEMSNGRIISLSS
jgi:hypothetical protein